MITPDPEELADIATQLELLARRIRRSLAQPPAPPAPSPTTAGVACLAPGQRFPAELVHNVRLVGETASFSTSRPDGHGGVYVNLHALPIQAARVHPGAAEVIAAANGRTVRTMVAHVHRDPSGKPVGLTLLGIPAEIEQVPYNEDLEAAGGRPDKVMVPPQADADGDADGNPSNATGTGKRPNCPACDGDAEGPLIRALAAPGHTVTGSCPVCHGAGS